MESKTKEDIKEKERCCESGNLFLSVTLISFGTILLLNNFGLISWQVWSVLWKFWPVILILWGIEAIAGKSVISNIVIGAIGTLITLFVIAYSITRVNSGFNKWVGKNYPLWKNIEKNLPRENKKGSFFDCSPFDESCYKFFSN